MISGQLHVSSYLNTLRRSWHTPEQPEMTNKPNLERCVLVFPRTTSHERCPGAPWAPTR